MLKAPRGNRCLIAFQGERGNPEEGLNKRREIFQVSHHVSGEWEDDSSIRGFLTDPMVSGSIPRST